MNIYAFIDNKNIPDSVKQHVIDFTWVKMKSGKQGLRVLLDRILTDAEKEEMRKCKRILGLDSVAHHAYVPEIKKSYFYIV